MRKLLFCTPYFFSFKPSRNALNKAERKDFFSDAMDSRSCLTTLLHFNDSPNVEFSFDVAILTKNRDGDYMRLIHNKKMLSVLEMINTHGMKSQNLTM